MEYVWATQEEVEAERKRWIDDLWEMWYASHPDFERR